MAKDRSDITRDSPTFGGGRLDITTFLAGTTHAHGVFQDRFGRIRRSFEITINGSWDTGTFVLDEAFLYDDGEREQRTWRIVPGPAGTFSATCPDCIGVAKGLSESGRWRMRYQFRLKLKSRALAVTFDDRMYRVGAHLAVNRASVYKWGVRLGEALIVFERQDAEPKTSTPGFAEAAE